MALLSAWLFCYNFKRCVKINSVINNQHYQNCPFGRGSPWEQLPPPLVSTPRKTAPEHLLGRSVLQLSPGTSGFDNFLFEIMVTKPLSLPRKMQEKDKGAKEMSLIQGFFK